MIPSFACPDLESLIFDVRRGEARGVEVVGGAAGLKELRLELTSGRIACCVSFLGVCPWL